VVNSLPDYLRKEGYPGVYAGTMVGVCTPVYVPGYTTLGTPACTPTDTRVHGGPRGVPGFPR